ncbi:MAG: hypothetical protein IPJ27_01130 [Candidatus Accumulibacter sp.]|uniref:Uncharacterized protein n=1 Tax=Candidatus Accumulibacter proximus TaxID=2954385 RepID=A0A935PW04_9PROT|nr:hypothetical protein [Candidatus Accumulibacter proximus]
MEKDTVLQEFCCALYEATLAEGGQLAFLSEIKAHSHLTHDIDVVVDRQAWGRLTAIIGRVETRLDWQLVQMIQYDLGDSVYFVIGRLGPTEDETIFVKFDILCDDLGLGCYGVRSHLLLKGVEMIEDLPAPAPEMLLAYLVQKRLTKRVIDTEQFSRLVGLRKRTNDEFDNALVTKHFPQAVLTRAYSLLALNDYMGFSVLISGQQARAKAPLLALGLRRAWHQSVRLARRVLDSVGRVVLLPSEAEGGGAEAETMKRLFDVPFRGRILIATTPPSGFRRMVLMTSGWLVLVVPQGKRAAPLAPSALYGMLAQAAKKRLLSRCER